MAAPRPLGFMTAINAAVAYYELSGLDQTISQTSTTSTSTPTSTPTSDSDPRLIVLLTWYAANDAYIAKYTDQYRRLFPGSRILLIRCSPRHLIAPWTIQGDLKPALDIMCGSANRPCKDTTRPKVLLHNFSNGGCNTAHNLLKTMRLRAASKCSPLAIPRYALVLDSCPGTFEWRSSYAAVMQPLPWAFGPLVHLLMGLMWVMQCVFRVLPLQDRNGQTLLEPELLEHESTRAYLYSAADTFVPCADVRDHAARAKAAGFTVSSLENFRDAGHVALARAEPDRYWKIIESTWCGAQD